MVFKFVLESFRLPLTVHRALHDRKGDGAGSVPGEVA
jgi:hypothetical protein